MGAPVLWHEGGVIFPEGYRQVKPERRVWPRRHRTGNSGGRAYTLRSLRSSSLPHAGQFSTCSA